MWSRKFACCRKCGTTDRAHGGQGYCGRCYRTVFYKPTGKINQNRRLSVDDYLFHGEWTERSAYLYGVLFADGHVSSGANHKICIGLSIADLDWIGSLRSLFKADAQIGFVESSKGTGRMAARLTFSSKQMHARLLELGIKKEPPPNMSLEMSRHFIRGLFDGDGSAFIQGQTGLLRFNLVGELFLCEWVISRVREFTGLTHKIGPYKKPNTDKVVSIQMAGNAALGFGKMIYGSQSVDCLNRKKSLWCDRSCLGRG